MDAVLIGLFVLMSVATLVRLVMSPKRVFEYPYALGAVFAAFIGPQLLTLASHQDRLPTGAFEPLALMTVLCFAACWVGYAIRPSGGFVRLVSFPLNYNRLFVAGVILLLFASFAQLKMHEAASLDEGRDRYGGFTGATTMWHFFAELHYPAMGIVFLRAVRTPNPANIVASLYSFWPPLYAMAFYGRREQTVLTGLIIALTLYFRRGILPPRLLVIATIVGCAILMPVITEYRMRSKDEGLGAIFQFNAIDVFVDGYTNGRAPEMALAAYTISAVDRAGTFGYGAGYWNTLVFRFVPAQVVGQDFKEGLKARDVDIPVSAYSPHFSPGTTYTGMADSYKEFGYLGCLFFAVIAVVLRNLWEAAAKHNSLPAQIIYMQILTTAMRSVTHQTYDFLPGLLYDAAFLIPVFLIAKERG